MTTLQKKSSSEHGLRLIMGLGAGIVLFVIGAVIYGMASLFAWWTILVIMAFVAGVAAVYALGWLVVSILDRRVGR